MSQLLRAEEVADQVRVEASTVRRWTRRRELPAINIGTERRPRWRYEPQAVEAFLSSRRSA